MPIETVRAWVVAAAGLLEEYAPHISNDAEAATGSSIAAAWYLHPQQHVAEFLGLNLLLVPLLWVLTAHGWRVIVPVVAGGRGGPRHARVATSPNAAAASPTPHRVAVWAGNDAAWRPVELLITALTLAVMCSTITYKVLSGRVLYLFQPCHVLNATLCYLATHRGRPIPAGSKAVDTPSWAFALYLHSMYGAWLGLCLPDTRDLLMPGEVVSFFTQHSLLCFVPLFYIARGRYNMLRARVVYCWSWKFLYHSNVLLPLSIVFAGNLNYIMVPPGSLVFAGKMYRPVMGGLCIVLTVLMRLVLVEATLAVATRPARPKAV